MSNCCLCGKDFWADSTPTCLVYIRIPLYNEATERWGWTFRATGRKAHVVCPE